MRSEEYFSLYSYYNMLVSYCNYVYSEQCQSENAVYTFIFSEHCHVGRYSNHNLNSKQIDIVITATDFSC